MGPPDRPATAVRYPSVPGGCPEGNLPFPDVAWGYAFSTCQKNGYDDSMKFLSVLR